MAVVVGSEGMLAITTEVTVRLVPKPQLARCIMASFNDIESAGAAVASVIARGIIPAGLELMDKAMTAAVEAFGHADYDLNAAAILSERGRKDIQLIFIGDGKLTEIGGARYLADLLDSAAFGPEIVDYARLVHDLLATLGFLEHFLDLGQGGAGEAQRSF